MRKIDLAECTKHLWLVSVILWNVLWSLTQLRAGGSEARELTELSLPPASRGGRYHYLPQKKQKTYRALGSLHFRRPHCWEPTVFPGEKRIQNGDILVFIANIEKLYFIMYHFSIYTIKTKINRFFMRFYSRTIVGSQLGAANQVYFWL